MSISVALWGMALSCLYFSFLHLFNFFAYADVLFVSTIFCVGISLYVASKTKYNLRIIGSVFLLIPIIIATGIIPVTEIVNGNSNWWQNDFSSELSFFIKLLIIILPIGYALYTIIKDNLEPIYWEKINLFKVISIVFVSLEIFFSLVFQKDMFWISIYLISYFLLMSLSLNLSRFGKALDKKGKGLYLGVIGLYSLVCGTIGCFAFLLIEKGSKFLEIILTPFAVLFSGLISVFTGLSPLFGKFVEKIPLGDTFSPSNDETVVPNEPVPEEIPPISNDASGEQYDRIIFILIIITIIVVVLYVLYRIYKSYKGRYYHVSQTEVLDSDTEFLPKKAVNKFSFFKSNNEKIRKEYVKHMKTIRGKGYKITKSSTSYDICNEGIQRLNHPDIREERIRDLYLKARYSDESVSDDDVKEMKNLV